MSLLIHLTNESTIIWIVDFAEAVLFVHHLSALLMTEIAKRQFLLMFHLLVKHVIPSSQWWKRRQKEQAVPLQREVKHMVHF